MCTKQWRIQPIFNILLKEMSLYKNAQSKEDPIIVGGSPSPKPIKASLDIIPDLPSHIPSSFQT